MNLLFLTEVRQLHLNYEFLTFPALDQLSCWLSDELMQCVPRRRIDILQIESSTLQTKTPEQSDKHSPGIIPDPRETAAVHGGSNIK